MHSNITLHLSRYGVAEVVAFVTGKNRFVSLLGGAVKPMPVLMFGAILGCGLLFYVSYRYVRAHPPMREEQDAPEDAPKEIAKGD
jgi:hypothetical protein